ncbi:carboxymuconolactone decarboxylase family protein [Siminovitchia sediminis]|uniref:Carboxymuconolactone decarboxylase family protein n=1 Tax=Siminovitchia sediminis TaxID=1274353 RepID=A0ABW4KL09_9BACI
MTKITEEGLYRKSNIHRLGELKDYAPEAFSSFMDFNNKALAEGKLSVKIKELIAVAVAHVTGCPYCIEIHVNDVKKAGANKEEVAEAIFVATALKAGSAFAHGVNALNAFDGEGDEELYKASYFNRIKEFARLSGENFSAFIDFDQQALKAGELTVKEKEIIAVAVAHVTGCPYCIDIHVNGAKKAGATLEEVTEAIFVAVALKAGSAFAHGVNALQAYMK